jgi:hypothetical protein
MSRAGLSSKTAAALALSVSALCSAYFVLWSCYAFGAGIPGPSDCSGFCCDACRCCDSPSPDEPGKPEPFCAPPGEMCPHCQPGETDACACGDAGAFGSRSCDENGNWSECACHVSMF